MGGFRPTNSAEPDKRLGLGILNSVWAQFRLKIQTRWKLGLVLARHSGNQTQARTHVGLALYVLYFKLLIFLFRVYNGCFSTLQLSSFPIAHSVLTLGRDSHCSSARWWCTSGLSTPHLQASAASYSFRVQQGKNIVYRFCFVCALMQDQKNWCFREGSSNNGFVVFLFNIGHFSCEE